MERKTSEARARRGRRTPASLSALAALLALGLSGCASLTAPERFDLRAAAVHARPSRATFAVPTPSAEGPLDGELIVVRGADGSLSRVPGVEWADRLPSLLQGRIVETFENAGLARQVAVAGGPAQYAVRVEARRFDIDAATHMATVEMTARLVAENGGRIVAAKIFSASAPVAEIAGAAPALALNRALADVLARMIPWAASLGR
ncbi:ABC-type transport auxiliary lipoprotein family protein [Rhodoblastus sp.]|uniref:ABC-type transport auxiliary lipoprotein family protein n=1 Tax=Rhodoblastus sp. TaxID=1962975 RepID=UPI003F98D340